MSTLEVAEAFELWKTDALIAIDSSSTRPEAQLTITALAGVYVAGSPVELRTSYDWRQSVLADSQVVDTLQKVLPGYEGDLLSETYGVPLDISEPKRGNTRSMHQQFFHRSIFDGMPESVTSVPSNEYYLAQTLGHCAYNFAIKFQPLAVDLSVSKAGLKYAFPRSLELMSKAISP